MRPLRTSRAILALAAGLALGPLALPAAGAQGIEPDYIKFATLPGEPQLGPDVGCVRIRGGGTPTFSETFQALGFGAGKDGIPENGGGDDVPLGPVAAAYSWRLISHHARYQINDPSEVGTIDPVTGVFTAGTFPTGYGMVKAVTPGGKAAEVPIFIVPPDFVVDPPPRIHHLTCEDRTEGVRLHWIPGGPYLHQSIYRDAQLIATLAGDAVSYDDAGSAPGIRKYEVTGTALDAAHNREVDSDPTPCLIAVRHPPTTHLLWAPVEQAKGRTKSAQAILEALLANGEEVFEVEDITGVKLRDFRAVWAIFGTYPDEHYIWLSETLQLASYLTADKGRLYIEGADIWGAVPTNAFLLVDGVFHCPPDDLLCVGIDGGGLDDLHSLRGVDSGNGLDLSAFAGPLSYTGENNFPDHLIPGPPGAAMIWFNADPRHDYGTGIAYRGQGYRTIECSFEFGGIVGDRVEILRRYLEFLEAGTRDLFFIRGDADLNGVMELTDAIRILGYLFLGDVLPDCSDAADATDDGVLDITDPIRILSFLYLGGEAPPAPFPSCGLDPTDDAGACLEHLPNCP